MQRTSTVFTRSIALALGLLLAACGSDDKTSGGSGGTGGAGGAGGTGGTEVCEQPIIEAVDPDSGYVGKSVRVIGRCFGADSLKIKVSFNNTTASVFAVTADGTAIDTQVPSGAVTGPVAVHTDYGNGFVRSDIGPTFTVTDEAPPPVLNSLSPATTTAGTGAVKITLQGTGFVPRSRVLMNGEEIDGTYATATSLTVDVPASLTAATGTHRFKVVNDEPGGGSTPELNFKVVNGINVVSAQAITRNAVIVTFDQSVGSGIGRGRDWAIRGTGGSSLRVEKAERRQGVPSQVYLTTASQTPDRTYTVTAPSSITSSEGGKIGTQAASFRTYGSKPVLSGSFGMPGCGADGLSMPNGLTLAGSTFYVTETTGQQVQLVGIDGTFGGFMGHDGTNAGFHVSGEAAGCPDVGSSLDGAFLFPRGGVAVDTAGNRYVGDTGNNRILAFDADGSNPRELGSTIAWQNPVVLGMIDGKVAVANGDDKIHLVPTTLGTIPPPLFGPGILGGQFAFGVTGDGVPAIARSGNFAYITDPANHRLQKFENLQPRGWIGMGHEDFVNTQVNCLLEQTCAGDGNGEFTWPSGVAVGADESVWVIDAANGGRLQRFNTNGRFLVAMNLGYMPGGIAVDADGFLWIADQENNQLHRYTP